ncbi:MAG TPA: low-complexity tail membrane protein [Trichocoleus sp.]
MRSFRLDPYLWVHLAGLAVVPLWLDICLLGLATGEPFLPTWMELGLVAGIGVLPIAWMQWVKPFYIFSLVFLAVRPDKLSEDRQRILRLFRDPLVKFLTALVPIPLVWGLGRIYSLAPLASDMTPLPEGSRVLGLLVAAIAFLLANLFTQVPVSVLRVLLTPQRVFKQVAPYEAGKLKQDFTVLGLRVNRILPDWREPAAALSEPFGEILEKPTKESLEEFEEIAAVADLTAGIDADVDLDFDEVASGVESSTSAVPLTPPSAEETADDWELVEESLDTNDSELTPSERVASEAAPSEAALSEAAIDDPTVHPDAEPTAVDPGMADLGMMEEASPPEDTDPHAVALSDKAETDPDKAAAADTEALEAEASSPAPLAIISSEAEDSLAEPVEANPHQADTPDADHHGGIHPEADTAVVDNASDPAAADDSGSALQIDPRD